MTSSDLAKKLAELGTTITAETVRKDWAKGAPRGSAEAYLRWREKHIAKAGSTDPNLKAARLELVQAQTRLAQIRGESEQAELQVRQGELIPRVWVVDRIRAMAADVNAARSRSEADDPLLFAAAAGDVAGCRTVVRGIWDGIFASLQSLSKHLAEDKAQQ